MKYPNWNGWPQDRPAIIAEVGVNHGGNESLAWEMILSAHDNGADFVKLQSFIMEDFFHPSLDYYSNTKSYELPLEAQRRLFEQAAKNGIKLITTAFDFHSVDMVEKFNPVAHKVASMDNDNIPLVRYIASKNRPVLVSLGMSNLDEIKKIERIINEAGNDKLVLVHCVSDYPTKNEDINVDIINLYKDNFNSFVGLSDHTIGLDASFVSIALGAVIIERHFTIDKLLEKEIPYADHNISIEPMELKELARFAHVSPIVIGSSDRKLTENENEGRNCFRRSLYARRDIAHGEKISLKNTVLLRPVNSIPAGDWDLVEGKEMRVSKQKYDPINYSDIAD